MASVVQRQVAPKRTIRPRLKRGESAGAPRVPTRLLARLRHTADPNQSQLVTPLNANTARYAEGSFPCADGFSFHSADGSSSPCADGSSFVGADGSSFVADGSSLPSFLEAQNVRQREPGLAAAVIGEPGIVRDSITGVVTRLDANDLLDLYESWGSECVGKLRGSWGIVILDRRQGRILLATDRMGRQPLYFRIDQDHVLVGSSLASLRSLAERTELDAQALYHYLYFHMIPAPDAVMQGFRKLAPASVLELTHKGHKLSRYWTPTFNETLNSPLDNAHAELRTRLRTAVERCSVGEKYGQEQVQSAVADIPSSDTSTDKKVGAFLSGGLDSSTVAGMLSEVQDGRCEAYTIGFDAEGYDETPYARIVASHFGIRLHEHYVTPDEVVEALPLIAAAFEEPFGNSSALPAYFCARMAAGNGTGVLLAGDGGDELFAGNKRYGEQKIFENYRRMPTWLRTRVVERLVKSAPDTLPLVSKAQSFIRQANTALPERLQYYSFLEQSSPDQVFKPAFLERVDRLQPLALLNDIYQLPGLASVLNRMLFLDWQITLADNDLRKVTQACELAGVKVRYPMLDDDLVEFSTLIPSRHKLPGNQSKEQKLRHFYKQALSGWLPDATISKRKHGFGLPFGLWMKTHKPLQELACDNILRLQRRGIFLPQFLDRAIASHRDGHAAYFGELIWVLVSLELWLTAHHADYVFEQD